MPPEPEASEPIYSGPERRTELRLRTAEVHLRLLNDQLAEHHVLWAEMDERLARAVASALREVSTDPQTLASIGAIAAQMLTKTARDQTGGFVLGWLVTVLKDWGLKLLVVYFVLKWAGIDAAAAVWKLFKTTT